MTKIFLGAALLLVAAAVALWIANASAEGSYGLRENRLTACPEKPNCVSSQASDESHFVPPLRLDADPAEALSRLKKTASALPGAKLAEERENYLRFTFTSRFLRFVDDVEFHVDEPAKVIHVRSASRLGYSDLGVNRERVETIRAGYLAKRS